MNLTYLTHLSKLIVTALHQNEGGIGKSIPDAQKISWDPRDFPRAKPEGNLEGRGKSETFSEAVGFAPWDPKDFLRAKLEGNPDSFAPRDPRPGSSLFTTNLINQEPEKEIFFWHPRFTVFLVPKARQLVSQKRRQRRHEKKQERIDMPINSGTDKARNSGLGLDPN